MGCLKSVPYNNVFVQYFKMLVGPLAPQHCSRAHKLNHFHCSSGSLANAVCLGFLKP